MPNKTLIIDHQKAIQKIERIAYEILENNFEEKHIVLVGISKRGFVIAQKIYDSLKKITDKSIELKAISIDKDNVFDESKINYEGKIEDLQNQSVIVIDDVLNSGKTLMYAVRYLLGAEIKKMNTAVLVDRRHRNFPIRADFAGLTLSTTLQEHISVEFNDDQISVYLV